MGFQVLGIRPGYYTIPNEDAYVMGLSLSNEQPAGES
jgi:ribosomal protein S18 acetylase RimI-like enzyme